GSSYRGGGVRAINLPMIDQQGLLQGTSINTDLAISGSGMFVVRPDSTSGTNSQTFFTRAGAFRVSEDGYLVNPAGYYLQGELLTQAQRNAVLSGNTAQLTSTSLNTLEPAKVDLLTGSALPTTAVNVEANLP